MLQSGTQKPTNSGTALLLLVSPLIPHENNGTTCPTYVFIVWKEDILLPAMSNPLYSSTNQQLFKKNFCNQSSHYENYGQFPLGFEAITCLPQNQHFSWWAKDTKEGPGKYMKNALYA